MMSFSQTYLYQLYKNFKGLFVVVVVWAIGTLWFVLKSHEEFPFLLFGMYSLKEEPQAEYISYTVYINGQEMIANQLPDARRELLLNSLAHYENTSLRSLYFKWLHKYVSNNEKVEVYKLTVTYNNQGAPSVKKRELLYAEPAK